MDQGSVVIDRFRTRLAMVGRQDDGQGLEREVTRVVRDLLPRQCARALGPRLDQRGGVVRIERLQLALSLGRAGLSAEALADRLAAELAREITDALLGGDQVARGVAAWPDHASFAAAYVGHRLGLLAAPEWAFPDFGPLAHLTPARAAVELFTARPAILLALARLLADRGGTVRLAAALPEPDAADLVTRLAASVPAPRPSDETAILAAMIEDLPQDPAASPGRAALTVAVAFDRFRQTDPAGVPARCALARMAVAIGAVARVVSLERGRAAAAEDLTPAALLHLPPAVRDLARSWIGAPARDPAERSAMVTALLGTRSRSAPSRRDVHSAESEVAGPAAPGAVRIIASRVAGLGLLLPAALRHGLPETLSPTAFHHVMIASIGEEHRAAARLDPLLAVLAPFDPRGGDPVFPPVPDDLRSAVPEAFRPVVAAAEGEAGWAACLLRAFAAMLPGFEASSPGYVRNQFLARPGRLVVAPDRMTLLLAPLPLGVVLRHAGLDGWIGPLRGPGNEVLRIEVEDG